MGLDCDLLDDVNLGNDNYTIRLSPRDKTLCNHLKGSPMTNDKNKKVPNIVERLNNVIERQAQEFGKPDQWLLDAKAEILRLRQPTQGKALAEALEKLVTAVEFEVPPIRNGIGVSRRLDILESCAEEARAALQKARQYTSCQ